MLKRKKTAAIDLNSEFRTALELMENTRKNIFITGRAGTGKSTLLSYFRKTTNKNIVVLAPTGVAAVNIAGQTIHSFFRFKPNVTLSKIKRVYGKDEIYEKLDTIVIDEISMVRADLLDCVDKFLRFNGPDRHRAFGGIQMIFIGDLYQLPPVMTQEDKKVFSEQYASPYFFSAHVISPPQQTLFDDVTIPRLGGDVPQDRGGLANVGEFDEPTPAPPCTAWYMTPPKRGLGNLEMEFVELQKMYRQNDKRFIHLLNSIRDNTAGKDEFAALNARHNPTFDPKPEELYIHLTTTNAMAEEVNARKLNELAGETLGFVGTKSGKFDDKYVPTTSLLEIKIGAQVMMLNNDSLGRWINGTIGQVESVEEGLGDDPKIIWVRLESGKTEAVKPHQWDIYEYTYNEAEKIIESESVGSFIQYPLKLAWAVTIHKSQGKTFERLVVDIGRGTFSAGQLYVALSRATTLEGLVLKKPVEQRHVWLDKEVGEWVRGFGTVLS